VRKDNKAFGDADVRMMRINEQPNLRVATMTFKGTDQEPAILIEFPDVSAQVMDTLVEAQTEVPEAEDMTAAKATFTEVMAMPEDTMRSILVQGTGGGLPIRSVTVRMGRRANKKSPPITIEPHRLEARFFRVDLKVTAIEQGEVINFWKCHAADFAVTEQDDA
jgi:hypothetical protein